MDLSFKNIISILEGKNSPIYLSNVLTQNYYEDYYNHSNLEDSILGFIREFYQLHYCGVRISKDSIESISKTFAFDFSLVVTCLYIIETKNKGQFLELCTENIDELYGIIQNTHDNICPNNRKSTHHFSKIDESEILFITGVKDKRNTELSSESFISVNELSEDEAKEHLVELISEDIINHIKETIEDITVLNLSPLGYMLLMNTINNYEATVLNKLKGYLFENRYDLDNYSINMIVLEASIIAKDRIWVHK